ncbi:pre-mRNA-splicing factor CWC22 homolog isoform X2 [Rhincodon typus]|nr:pre-mRNA-splicing factor CWC22 homolog isoform X2 [Rhincodon typus]
MVGEMVEDCREQNSEEQHETNILSGPARVTGEKGTTAEGSGKAHSSVPVETPSEDLQLLAQYMIITDTYQDEDHSLAELQVEDMITLDMDNDVQLNAPKMDSAQLMMESAGIKKMSVTGNARAIGELSFESTEKEHYPGTEQNNGKTVKDEGFGKANKKDRLIVVGCEPNKSSIRDGKHVNNEVNPLKGLSDSHRTSDAMDKNQVDLQAESELKDNKRSAEEKVRSLTGSKPSCESKVDNDRGQSRDRPSVHGKSNNQTNNQGSSRKQDNDDDRKDRHREKDDHKHRSSHSRTRSSERKRIGRGRSRNSERGRSRWSLERRRKSRSSEGRKRSRSSERGWSHWSSERRRRSRSSERRRSRSSERRRRSRSSERRRSKERRRTSRSRSCHRRSSSKKRDSYIEKTRELKEQPWRLDPKEALWAFERRREREIWEEEARELLERDLDRLQLERMCLERGRLDESFPIRQRLLLGEAEKQTQERTYRQREWLLQKMCLEEAVKRQFFDIGPHGAWERETKQEWEGRELDQVKYERLRLDRKTLEPETQERLPFFLGGVRRTMQSKCKRALQTDFVTVFLLVKFLSCGCCFGLNVTF